MFSITFCIAITTGCIGLKATFYKPRLFQTVYKRGMGNLLSITAIRLSGWFRNQILSKSEFLGVRLDLTDVKMEEKSKWVKFNA